jgi:hypothetical protein
MRSLHVLLLTYLLLTAVAASLSNPRIVDPYSSRNKASMCAWAKKNCAGLPCTPASAQLKIGNEISKQTLLSNAKLANLISGATSNINKTFKEYNKMYAAEAT